MGDCVWVIDLSGCFNRLLGGGTDWVVRLIGCLERRCWRGESTVPTAVDFVFCLHPQQIAAVDQAPPTEYSPLSTQWSLATRQPALTCKAVQVLVGWSNPRWTYDNLITVAHFTLRRPPTSHWFTAMSVSMLSIHVTTATKQTTCRLMTALLRNIRDVSDLPECHRAVNQQNKSHCLK